MPPEPGLRIVAIIPARDEAGAIAQVVTSLPRGLIEVVVVDNGSRDDTADRARQAGAIVVSEASHGYGAACLAGVAAAGRCDVLLFLDGDGSDDGAEALIVLGPILRGEADLVIGSRVLGGAGRDAMTPAQRYGNVLAAWLIRRIWAVDCTDLGPYRAITTAAYQWLGMVDRDFGWTVEMQARAHARGLIVREVPISRGPRLAGRSKITGTVSGVVRAGVKILTVIGREACATWIRGSLGKRPTQGAPGGAYRNSAGRRPWRRNLS
jgi:hypothetical protein